MSDNSDKSGETIDPATVAQGFLSTHSASQTVQALDLVESSPETPQPSETPSTLPQASETPLTLPQTQGTSTTPTTDDSGRLLSELKELGATPHPDEGSAPLAQIKETMDGVEGLVHPYSVLSGVVFLNRVAAQTETWLSTKAVTREEAARLLSAALEDYRTSMRVDQLPDSNVGSYLTMGFTQLCGTWGTLNEAADRVAFVKENMNTDKYNYGRAIEGLGRAPARKMGVEDILLNQLHRNTNTNTLGGPASAQPSTSFDQLLAALDKGGEAAKNAANNSLSETLAHIWDSHFRKFKDEPEERDKLGLEFFTGVVWAQWETIVTGYPEGAQAILRELYPDRGALKEHLDDSLMLWEDDGELEATY